MACWLVKSEPGSYGIDDLKRDKKSEWTGVRNYAARNFLRAMKKNDVVLFYHSGAEPGVVGCATVTKAAYADPTAEAGDWSAVELTFKAKYPNIVSLSAIKSTKALSEIALIKQSRLSVMPITDEEFKSIESLDKR